MIEQEKYVKVVINPLEPAKDNSGVSVNNVDITITENGVYEAEQPYTGYGKVTVEVPQPTPVIERLSVVPKTYAQEIGVTSDIDGYGPVRITAVTSSIDSNIQAGNIKSGVTILGVTGTYDPRPYPYRKLSIKSNGQLSSSKTTDIGLDVGNLTFSDVGNYALAGYCVNTVYTGDINYNNITNIDGTYAFTYAFYGASITGKITFNGLTGGYGTYVFSYAFYNSVITGGIEFNGFTQITNSNYLFYYAFRDMTGNVSFNNLEVVNSSYCFSYAFYGLNGTVRFPKLKSVTNTYAFQYAFGENNTKYPAYSPTIVGIFDSLESVTAGNAFRYAFYGNKTLTDITFSKLKTVNSNNMLYYGFGYCTNLTSLSFPALTSGGLGSYTSQFSSMLSGCTGVTVHFPSNLQSVIGSWSSVTGGFGGTNTTVLFDLTATS